MACKVLMMLMSTSSCSNKINPALGTALSNHYFPAIVKLIGVCNKKWLPWCPLMLMFLAQDLD